MAWDCWASLLLSGCDVTAPTPVASTRARRAKWPWVVLVIVVVIAVLLVAAELVARAVLPNTVRSLVIEQLDLPADQQLDVEASGILLPQLIFGKLDELKLSSDKVTLGGITGSAHVTATQVPVRSDGVGGEPLGSAKGTVSIDQSQFAALLEHAQLPGTEITLQAPNATVQGAIPVFGREIPVGLTVTPGADDGDLLLTPVSVELGGKAIDLQALGAFLGEAGTQLAAPQHVCIADRLPAGITLIGLRIEGSRAVADITADARIAVDPRLLEYGTCPR